eukprot:4004146-Pleurochrysis_carterae.AAC.1
MVTAACLWNSQSCFPAMSPNDGHPVPAAAVVLGAQRRNSPGRHAIGHARARDRCASWFRQSPSCMHDG